MNALNVYWHPEPKSFNHAMFTAAGRFAKRVCARGSEPSCP